MKDRRRKKVGMGAGTDDAEQSRRPFWAVPIGAADAFSVRVLCVARL